MFCARVSRLVLAVLMVILAGCQVVVDVDLDVLEDGSGTVTAQVTLDREATAAFGDVGEQLRIDDLERAGWSLTVEEIDFGSTQVTASKQVARPEQWQQVLDEIAGPDVFNEVQVESENGFATVSQQVTFELDLSEGWALLGGNDAGSIEGQVGGRPIDDVVAVLLTTTVTAGGDSAPMRDVSEPRFDDAEPLRVSLATDSENATAILLRWVAVALFSLFVLAIVLAGTGIVLQRRADQRRPTPTPASLASRVPGSAPVDDVAAGPSAAVGVRLVVVEPLAVFYQQPSFASTVLRFIRSRGGLAPNDVVSEAYAAVTSGSITSGDFWTRCDLGASRAALDQALIDERRMRPGAVDFLAEMERRRIPVAAMSTDGSDWSHQTRDRDRLRQVWPWLTSADVGAVAGNVAMFEVLRRESGVAYEHCLYVDTEEVRLDVARELGMKTVLLTSESDADGASSHPVASGFKGLL